MVVAIEQQERCDLRVQIKIAALLLFGENGSFYGNVVMHGLKTRATGRPRLSFSNQQ
jgi:hypothetical protein